MTDTTSNDLTASDKSSNEKTYPSLYSIAVAISQNPGKWIYPGEKKIVVYPIENHSTETVQEIFINQEIPDGGSLRALQALLPYSPTYVQAVNDYLNNPDSWDVVMADP